jgi:hypothetical protein
MVLYAKSSPWPIPVINEEHIGFDWSLKLPTSMIHNFSYLVIHDSSSMHQGDFFSKH